MARNQDIQILVDLIKLISSSPTTEQTEKVLETVITNIAGGFPSVKELGHDPTTQDLPNDKFGVFRNTATGQVSVWANDNGTMRNFISAA